MTLDIDPAEPTDAELHTISALARRQVELEATIEKWEQELQRLKEGLRQVSEVDLPEALSSAGMSSFTLNDGKKVALATAYKASISKDKAPGAFAWLEEHGHADIIKHEVSVKFGKGEDNSATKLVQLIRQQPYANRVPIDEKRYVHPQTLVAFVREQLHSMNDDVRSLFGVYIQRYTKITPPKEEM